MEGRWVATPISPERQEVETAKELQGIVEVTKELLLLCHGQCLSTIRDVYYSVAMYFKLGMLDVPECSP